MKQNEDNIRIIWNSDSTTLASQNYHIEIWIWIFALFMSFMWTLMGLESGLKTRSSRQYIGMGRLNWSSFFSFSLFFKLS